MPGFDDNAASPSLGGMSWNQWSQQTGGGQPSGGLGGLGGFGGFGAAAPTQMPSQPAPTNPWGGGNPYGGQSVYQGGYDPSKANVISSDPQEMLRAMSDPRPGMTLPDHFNIQPGAFNRFMGGPSAPPMSHGYQAQPAPSLGVRNPDLDNPNSPLAQWYNSLPTPTNRPLMPWEDAFPQPLAPGQQPPAYNWQGVASLSPYNR